MVEDNADARDLLVIMLRRSGPDVRAVADGASALIEAETFAPEIVLLDIGLPQMDGYALAEHLRALPQTAAAGDARRSNSVSSEASRRLGRTQSFTPTTSTLINPARRRMAEHFFGRCTTS